MQIILKYFLHVTAFLKVSKLILKMCHASFLFDDDFNVEISMKKRVYHLHNEL